jgi:hypothetical protein
MIEDFPSLENEYARREIEEGLRPMDFSADDADWDSYYSQLRPFDCVECGQSFTGKGRLCSRCYVWSKS